MTEETTDDFDWNPLGAAWWADAGKQLGAKPRQIMFATAKHRGCSNTEAARQAGYGGGDSNSIRSTGYRLARSNITERLLAFAAAEASGQGYDNTVNRDEAKRILSSLARGSDPSVRIRACEQLAKMDEADRQQSAAAEVESSPEEILKLIAEFSPLAAAELAGRHGASLEGLPPDAKATAERHLDDIAFNWIRDHAARAKELADFWLRPAITNAGATS